MKYLLEIIEGLVVRDGTAKSISHTRFWSSVAYATSTWVIVHLTLNNTLTEDFLLWYLAVVAGHTSLSKFLSLRGNKTND